MSTTAELLKGAAELFPDEVVTQAHVRHLDLPGGAGRFALITLDNGLDHTKPTTFGPQSLANLNAAIDQVEKEAADGAIVGVGVTGKPFIFAVGADLKGVELLKRHEDALAIGKGGHDVFKRLSDARRARPSRTTTARRWAAASRSACTAPTAPSPRRCPAFSLPEVFLGLVPGWGGCTLLPNLIGADRAVTVIIENSLNQNRQLKGKQVFELGHRRRDLRGRGLPGAVADLDRGRAQGRDRGRARPRSTAARPGTRPSRAAASSPTPRCTARPRPPTARWTSSPRPRTATCGRASTPRTQALADLIMGGELRSGIYAFNLVQKRAKRPAGAPDKSLARPVTKVGVVGAGLMASQLALLFAAPPGGAGRADRHRPGARRQGRRLRPRRDRQAAGQGPDQPGQGQPAQGPGDRSRSTRPRPSPTPTSSSRPSSRRWASSSRCSPRSRRSSPAHAILATNTSSLSVTEMASKLEHPERVVGFHFFNPVAILPLLEIVRGEKTDDASLATAFGGGQEAEEDRGPGQGRPGVRRQPDPDPLHGRDPERHRRGHPGRRRRARRRAAGPADVPAGAAGAGRPGHRPARLRDAARAPSRTASRSRENLAARGRGRQARLLRLRLRQAGAGPGGRRAARAGRHAS